MNRLLTMLYEWTTSAPAGTRRETAVRMNQSLLEFDLRQMKGDVESLITRGIGWVELKTCRDAGELIRWHFEFACKQHEKQSSTSSRPKAADQ